MKIILLFLINLSILSEVKKKVITEQIFSLWDALKNVNSVFKWTPKAGKANNIIFSLEKSDVFQKGLVIVLTSTKSTMAFDIINEENRSLKIETFSLEGNIVLYMSP